MSKTINFDFIEKQNLIYMNFKLHHHFDRPICFDYFKKFDWVDIENNILPLKDFYDKLKTFKYCVSPRGTGIDTHRVYECLLYGVIPIVKKSTLDDLYENLPVLLVDKWEDVTYELLVNSYDENMSKYFEWKNNNIIVSHYKNGLYFISSAIFFKLISSYFDATFLLYASASVFTKAKPLS